ncbi:MAG: acetylornithine/succinylornithine family transaminase [Spirochaetaceae bacterium]|nr:acetylornithine/succinylornithine family transaminase [Spirochaetaceae bacterium]
MSKVVVNNYSSFQVEFVQGTGSTLIDTNNKEYIDFVSGIGVNCLGHNHPKLVQALQDQTTKMIHISNYYHSDIGVAYAKKILSATNMERIYFGNSGAEANECAIKLARKYGWLNKTHENAEKNIIVTLKKSFHGRTLATLKATGQDKFHVDAFAPYPEGFRYIQAGDYQSLDSIFDERVCAFMLECVQGEGDVNLIDKEWAKAASSAARKVGALIICDEVQTGMGRTGQLLASNDLDINPDVITLAKGIAGGIPMGACIFRGKAADVFVAGDHQSTFAGNPLACRAANVVLDELTAPGFLERVQNVGNKIRQTVDSWNLICIKEIRGKGLMIGIDVEQNAYEIQKKCLEKGLCISTAGANTLRFLPPLVITDLEIEKGLAVLKEVLS